MLDIDKSLNILSDDGPFSQLLKGYETRPQQQMMMQNIIEAFNQDEIALIEAGTGTGKSLAYLIPAILWAIQNKKRTLISTNTITLQEQLLKKDIPLVTNALGIDIKAVLVKGMSNYACLRKMQDAQEEKSLLSHHEAEELDKLEEWSETTVDGSRSDLPFEPSLNTWERICAESDTCNHAQCPYYKECHFFKARRHANDANILVANHSMLFADLVFRKEEDNYRDPALLPAYSKIILDEAHNLEDVATEFFADRVTHLQLLRTVGRLAAEKKGKTLGKLPLLQKKLYEHYRNQPSEAVSSIHTRFNIDLPGLRRELLTQIRETFQTIHEFMRDKDEFKLRIINKHHRQSSWSEEIVPSVQKLMTTTQCYTQAILSLENDIKNLNDSQLNEKTEGIRFDVAALAERLNEACLSLESFILQEQDPNSVRWIETQQLKTMTNIHLVNAKIDVSEEFVEHLFSKFPTTILCSATLTTNQKFDFFRTRLGLNLADRSVTENIYDSPFDYQEQALLAVPSDIPPPSDSEYISAVSDCIWQAIHTSRGNAFVLFTSYSMLEACHQKLVQRLVENRFNVFKQGDHNRLSLLDKFKATNYSILFGTDSFWQGVDVVGEALRCVIIVKLPFRVPTEPLIQARAEAITAKGGDSFFEYFVPNAIVKFKQGFGRLIRNKKDRGCIVCLDSRLITKGYGKLFLNSLPNCKQIFVKSDEISEHLKDFYRKTHYLLYK